MSRLNFLTKYATDGIHYDSKIEIDKALNDESWFVREAAAKHPKATKEHLCKALMDNNWLVRYAAKYNPNYKKRYKIFTFLLTRR